MNVEIVRLDAARRADFHRVHSEEHGCGWCCCIAWWVPTWDGWDQRTGAENRALREDLFDRGEYDGYLLYVDGAPAGWCQAGPRDRLTKLVRQYRLPPDPGAWAVTCFQVLPPFRRRGLAARLLAGVLEDLRARGVARVEAFPKRTPMNDPLDLWTGPEAMFLATGFKPIREEDRGPVLSLDL